MKKILTLFLFIALAGMIHAQQSLKVETFRLDNGLKVILCEEHSQPKIYGCVVVHAGSKNENPNATGVAHYFEHIMFKGTDRIGTTDWAKEKPYLDSISQAYDRLQAAKNDKERHDIQLEINRLSIAASQYAIPNEVDAILQNMGCTGLNAGTSYDYTVYYNTLPSNQLINWMDVYVERFRNPVSSSRANSKPSMRRRTVVTTNLRRNLPKTFFPSPMATTPMAVRSLAMPSTSRIRNPARCRSSSTPTTWPTI